MSVKKLNMKNSVLILLLLEYVFCRNLETDLTKDRFSSRRLQAVTEDGITLLIYTQADTTGVEIPLSDANNITEVSSFNTALKTVFFAHGWQGTVDDYNCVLIRTTLLANANVNVIIINWDDYAADPTYIISQQNVPNVGTYVGEFIATVAETYSYSLSDITVVGHSLGAHLAGFIGKATSGEIGIIFGLDPAGPGYLQALESARLNEDDAQYVQAIHTDGLVRGVSYNVGDVDFWPNGGTTQPACGVLDSSCSHQVVVDYFAESITNNNFYARECDSYANFQLGNCQDNVKTLMGGLDVDTTALGDFFLDTNAASPYGMGDVV